MAGSVNAGSIVYEVDMDTAKLIASRREVDAALNGMSGSMGRLEASVNRTERSVASMEGALSSLSGVAKGVIAALSVQQVAQYGNEWVTVNNKLANSVRSTEQLADVTQRVFDISQNTMSSLTATATLYGRLERATRSAGTSTQELITLTSTINKGLAVSGATTEEASSTMTQLSQALASGVLRGEEFNSISENGSRLAVALADSLGVTIGQLRAMAAQGKLTTEVVVNGLLQQSDKIAKEFANTAMTMGQAMTIATNNITKFIGESSTVSTGIKAFNSGVISLSQNLDTISTALVALTAVMGSRFAGALAMATAAKVKDTAATIAASKASAVAAKDVEIEAAAKLRLADIEKAATIQTLKLAEGRLTTLKTTQASVASEVRLAEAEAASIRTTIAQIESEKALEIQRLKSQITDQGRIATATRMAQLQQASAALNTRLAAAEAATAQARASAIASAEAAVSTARLAAADATGAATAANGRYIASQEAAVIATRAASTSLGLLRGAMGLVGGPAGVVMIAAASLYYMYTQMQQTKTESIEFASTLDTVISKMKEMSQVQLKGDLAKTGDAIDALKEKLSDQRTEQDKARDSVAEFQRQLDGLRQSGAPIEVINEAQKRLTASMRSLDKASSDVDSTSRLLSTTLQKQSQIQDELNQKARDSDAAFNVLASNLREKIPNASSAAIAAMVSTMEVLDQLKSKASDNPKPQEPEVSSKAQDLIRNAERRLALSKLEGEARAKLQAQYDAEDAGIEKGSELVGILQSQYAETERNSAAKKANAKEANANANAQESISQKLSKLKEQSELAASSTAEMSREQAVLRAQQSLGKGATDDQIRQAGEYAAKTFDSAKAIRDLAQAEQGRKFATQEIAAAAVMPDAQTGAVQNPTAEIDMREQQKLEALAKYQAIDLQNAQLYEDAKTAIQEQAANARQQIAVNEANMQSQAISSIVGSVSQGFDGLANLAAGAAGKSSGAYQAMFALSKGFAVAQAALNLQLAISQALADPTALTTSQKFANYAAIAAAGGSLLSSIGSISMSGAREHGGPVNASSMYRVGEGGKPEIFKASNGSQYMIPGDNGSVISNREMSGSGGGVNQIHQTIQVNGNPDDRTLLLIQQAARQGAKEGYQMVTTHLATGQGKVSKALGNGWTAKRRAG